MESALDAAISAALKDQTKADAFYDLFLGSQLFIPTADGAAPEQNRRAGENETFRPILLTVDGKPVLPVFDSEERLVAWAKRQVGLLVLPAHALLGGMDPKVEMALNIGTPGFKHFVVDELAWLRQRLTESAPQPVGVASGTPVIVAAPKDPSPALIAALRVCLARNDEVSAAHLALLSMAGQQPQLTLALALAPASETVMQAIMRDISVAVQAALGSRTMDIMVMGADGLSKSIAETAPLVYKR